MKRFSDRNGMEQFFTTTGSYESIVQPLVSKVIKDEYGALRNDDW
jgi:hypothetical protein